LDAVSFSFREGKYHIRKVSPKTDNVELEVILEMVRGLPPPFES
jgi:hypothetical protein